MKIITYCSDGYRPLLDMFKPTWRGGQVVVYTPEKLGLENTEDWKENLTRKILSIKKHIESSDDRFLYLDADCVMTDYVDEVFKLNRHDIICTRIIHRKERPIYEKEANAGVVFFRNNIRTQVFVEEWEDRARKYLNDPKLTKYHEQTAFSHLCYEGFDGLKPWSVGVVSEKIYNCEHDEEDKWLETIRKHEPKIIHFKNGWWKRDDLRQKVFSFYGIINS